MRELLFETVAEVPDDLWDAAAPADFFFQKPFMQVMEESGVEDARYRYVLVLQRGLPVGFAVLSRFVLRLDLLAGDAWVGRMRRVTPWLLDVPLVACGIPASLGQHHLHVADPELAGDVVERVHVRMEDWAR